MINTPPFANIREESNDQASYYRPSQQSYAIAHGNASSFFGIDSTILHNIGYEGLSNASIFTPSLEPSYLQILSFQQLIHKQLVYLERLKQEIQALGTYANLMQKLDTTVHLLRQFSLLFSLTFAAQYQAPKLLLEVELGTERVYIRLSLSPLTKVHLWVGESLAYQHKGAHHPIPLVEERTLDLLADIFAQYGTLHSGMPTLSAF